MAKNENRFEKIKEIRHRTGAELMPSLKAFDKNDGDVELAIKYLLDNNIVSSDSGSISNSVGRPILEDRNKVKTHRVTIAFNDEEYENLLSFKDFLAKKTLASTINYLMDEGKIRIAEKAESLSSMAK